MGKGLGYHRIFSRYTPIGFFGWEHDSKTIFRYPFFKSVMSRSGCDMLHSSPPDRGLLQGCYHPQSLGKYEAHILLLLRVGSRIFVDYPTWVFIRAVTSYVTKAKAAKVLDPIRGRPLVPGLALECDGQGH